MKLRALVLALFSVLAVGQAQAAIIFHLDDPIQSGSVDTVLRFHGTVSNTGPESFTSAGFGLSFEPFFPAEFELMSSPAMTAFRPGPGGSFTGEILAARVTAAAVGKSRTVTIYLYSWQDGSGPSTRETLLLSNPQTITLSSGVHAPEPGTVLLMTAGLGVLGLVQRRRAQCDRA